MLRAAYLTFVVGVFGWVHPEVARAADECPGICPLGHVCVQGQCVPESEAPPTGQVITPQPTPSPTPAPSPTPPPTATTTTTTSTSTSTIPIEEQTSVPIQHGALPVPTPEVDPWERLFSLTIDPLGFALYGPSIKFEVGTMISGYARVRFPNAGLVHIAQNIDDTEFDWGISAGGGIRGYIGRESQQGFLMGAGFEIAYTVRRSDSENDFGMSRAIWSTTSFLPGLEVGYRLVTASGFTFTVAGGAIYIINLGFDSRGSFPDPTFRDPPQPTQNEVYPMVQLDLGYAF